MTMPPRAGDSTTVAAERGDHGAERRADRAGVGGVLEHQRALEVLGAVQARGEAEMTFEQGAGAPEKGEDVVLSHGGSIAGASRGPCRRRTPFP